MKRFLLTEFVRVPPGVRAVLKLIWPSGSETVRIDVHNPEWADEEQSEPNPSSHFLEVRGKFFKVFPKVVCLCGSTRFMEAFQEANLRETMEGNIVLSVGCNTKSDAELILEKHGGQRGALKQKLNELHKRKIDLADEILVLDCQGYYGDSTRSEIEYATAQGKYVRYLSQEA